MKYIHYSLLIALLSGCAATKKSTNEQPLVVNEQSKLATIATKYPQDTVALSKLVQLRLRAYEAQGSLNSLLNVLAPLEQLIARQPNNYDNVLKYYRLNLFKGFALRQYDIEKWTHFYQKHSYLKSVDLAPPQYMEILLAAKGSLSVEQQKKILLKTLTANPNFINAYIDLALIYAEQDNLQLPLHLLNTATKYSPENPEVLTPLNELRIENVYQKMCVGGEQPVLKQAFNDYKTLLKKQPDDGYLHMQLSTVLSLMNRNVMASFSAKKAASLSSEYQDILPETYMWSHNNKAFEQYFQNKKVTELSEDNLYLLLFSKLINFDWQQAQPLVDEYISRDKPSFYGVIYGAYAYKMLGQDSKAANVLTQGLSKIELEPWQQQMLKFSRGSISDKQLLNIAKDKCQQSEAMFIHGLEALKNKNERSFTDSMKAIEALKVYAFYEYIAAKHILKRTDS